MLEISFSCILNFCLIESSSFYSHSLLFSCPQTLESVWKSHSVQPYKLLGYTQFRLVEAFFLHWVSVECLSIHTCFSTSLEILQV